MRRASVLLLLLFGCPEGPQPVDVTPFDAGLPPVDSGMVDTGLAKDTGLTDTGTVTDAGGTDAGPVDSGDGGSMDAEPTDTGTVTDGGPQDGAVDGGLDAGLDAGDTGPGDAGDAGPDGGNPDAGDAGPQQLVEDFTDPLNEIFTCPDLTDVLPAGQVENGTQCLGIDGFGCPADRMLPGPGDVLCADATHNPFIGVGQCVTDFFTCFDPSGTCTDSGTGTFTWGNGAVQIIQLDPATGGLIEARFIPSGSTLPCVIAVPDPNGGSRVIYTQQ